MSFSVSAGRISFALGLKGPSYVVDTACSSALVALDCSASTLRKGHCSAALSAAANVMTTPGTYISFSKPRMLSLSGRCYTFNASADGYARGEGAGAVVLRPREARMLERSALRGVAVNQDGCSSTLTAPNGPSQQKVMMAALAEARLAPEKMAHMECHGTGTPLGDPIEMGGLQSVHTSRGASPLAIAAVKSNCGHLEGPAASTGLVKSILLMEHAVLLSSLHLRQLNPSIAALKELPAAFITEVIPFLMLPKLNHDEQGRLGAGLSSFGFSGTNAHGVVSRATDACDASQMEGRRRRSTQRPNYQRQSFPWRQVGFRLLRTHAKEGIFEVAVRADVYDVVKHHVVFGSIVVPGVVFVEMALEATQELFGTDVSVTNVNMLFPFVVPTRRSETDPFAVMRFVLTSDSHFQIQSTSSTGMVTVHAEGGIQRRKEEADLVELEMLKSQVHGAVATSDVYKVIDDLGLYLGPMFQTAKQLWRQEPAEDSGSGPVEVLGRLQLGEGVPNLGYVLHPAVFDGTIHILATASVGKAVSDLKIFGGVGKVSIMQSESFSQLEEYWVWLRIKEKLEVSETFDVKAAV